jgi:hypothetical protein
MDKKEIVDKKIKLREMGGGNFPKTYNSIFNVRIGPYLRHYKTNNGKNLTVDYKLEWTKFPKGYEWLSDYDTLSFDSKENLIFLGDLDYEIIFV